MLESEARERRRRNGVGARVQRDAQILGVSDLTVDRAEHHGERVDGFYGLTIVCLDAHRRGNGVRGDGQAGGVCRFVVIVARAVDLA